MWHIQILCHRINSKKFKKEDEQMKTARKVLSVFFVVIMVMSLSIPAFAAGTGSITVTNATTGKAYSVYKVFDLTYINDSVAYTYKKGASDPFFTALTAADSPFELTATTNVDVFNVSTSANEETIAAWLKTNAALLGSPEATENAASSTVSFTNLDLGYYYVTSGLGSAVTLTSAKPSVQIVDKNQKPAPDPTDGYKSIVNGNQNTESISAQYGETVTFELKATASNYDGATKIREYIAHDLPGTGYTDLNLQSITVNGTTLTGSAYSVSVLGTGEVKITIPWVDDSNNFIYTNDGITSVPIVVTLTATVTDVADSRTNTGWFTWTNSPDNPNEHDDVEVLSYSITIDKYDSNTQAKLQNAEFVLKNSENKFYKLTNGVVSWENNQADADVFKTDVDGAAVINGLKNGTYNVMEIKAPDGYVLATTGAEVTINDANGEARISNTKGSSIPLPETGGLGTVLFTVFGVIVVITAGVFLVTNKRMSKEDI